MFLPPPQPPPCPPSPSRPSQPPTNMVTPRGLFILLFGRAVVATKATSSLYGKPNTDAGYWLLFCSLIGLLWPIRPFRPSYFALCFSCSQRYHFEAKNMSDTQKVYVKHVITFVSGCLLRNMCINDSEVSFLYLFTEQSQKDIFSIIKMHADDNNIL